MRAASSAPTPTLDGEAAVAELGDALPGDLAVGIGQRHDHAGDAGFGDRDRARRGAPLVRARLEGGVDGGAAGAVAGGPQRLDLGVGATGRLGRALADDLAVAHHDGADPRVGRGAPPGGVALGEGPAHELGVSGHQLRSVSLSGSPREGREAGRRGNGASAPSVVVCALSHPDSHRRPRLLTGSTTRLAAVGSRAPRL